MIANVERNWQLESNGNGYEYLWGLLDNKSECDVAIFAFPHWKMEATFSDKFPLLALLPENIHHQQFNLME